MYRIGLDIGSTTLKAVVMNAREEKIYTKYVRHNAKIKETLDSVLSEIREKIGDIEVSVGITGSIGMGVAESCGFPFVQEVVAATKAIRHSHHHVKNMIDIGGEDAKVVFFNEAEEAEDLRMNGNCAGGTGAFIDQMAIILGEDINNLSDLAMNAKQIHPIASRCGVFCKTDIQNLIAKNVSREDISASIFRAVVVQTVVTLAHGNEIQAPVLFCGGPLTFIPALRKAFMDYLNLQEKDVILPEDASLFPAYGTAISHKIEKTYSISELFNVVEKGFATKKIGNSMLRPLFKNEEDHQQWRKKISADRIQHAELQPGYTEAFLGIDSGSTTTKVVVTDRKGRLLYTFYSPNMGNPVKTVKKALHELSEKCAETCTVLDIVSSCSTGYGEDLIKAAFSFEHSIIETIAHFIAAKKMDKDVSFILDIGGQDMKAIYVNNGIINRIEINEACSSGCGSFIETFAKSTGNDVVSFTGKACQSTTPCDLGTRCTVFMNSKVKQVLREGYEIDDIAAGLAYSVIKNCLYKVLKLNDTTSLGNNIVVQGGTMKNDAVVKALENLTGAHVSRSEIPELMGAYGCALYAIEHCPEKKSEDMRNSRIPEVLLSNATYTTKTLNCSGCENSCLILAYKFNDSRVYYSGNRCERIFSNSGYKVKEGESVYPYKTKTCFAPHELKSRSKGTKLGIPRCLNIYEDYPFWAELFAQCGIETILSSPSTYRKFVADARLVTSDNICFPAKLVHSHITDLQNQRCDRIFMPFVIHSRDNGGQNSYNCPIVTGYSEVVKNIQHLSVPLDSPVFSMKDEKLFREQCIDYLQGLGIDRKTAENSFTAAQQSCHRYNMAMAEKCSEILADSRKQKKLTILLAGRPYHSDPLIQHDVAKMIASMGVNVISEDIVRSMDIDLKGVNFVSQWTYTNRIMQAAKWCAEQPNDIQFVQMTSFGCGPDAFLVDIIRDILMHSGKSLTILKLDDINNVGSMKLRVRSLIDSIRLAGMDTPISRKKYYAPPRFEKKDKKKTIIAPFFTPFFSPMIPALMKDFGYTVHIMPMSDQRSAEYGLKYANNEVCYPATLIIGDLIKGLKEGGYDPDQTAVAITQTGGQCRASNYYPMIKKAIIDAGYRNTPVISVSFGSGIELDQPGFKLNWLTSIPKILYGLLYSDCIAKMYYPCAARENRKGIAAELKDRYLSEGASRLEKGEWKSLKPLLADAAEAFNKASIDKETKKVGVVGEIFLKFNPFAHKFVVDHLMEQGIEIAPPMLTDFFSQFFVNRVTKIDSKIEEGSRVMDAICKFAYMMFKKQTDLFDRIASGYRYYLPFNDIIEESREAKSIININTQFGEGWLLPAEVATYYKQGVKNVLSLQPFGCIANHIIEKGIEKKLKTVFPDLNLLSLDFDSGVSDVNVTNRVLLFLDNMK